MMNNNFKIKSNEIQHKRGHEYTIKLKDSNASDYVRVYGYIDANGS